METDLSAVEPHWKTLADELAARGFTFVRRPLSKEAFSGLVDRLACIVGSKQDFLGDTLQPNALHRFVGFRRTELALNDEGVQVSDAKCLFQMTADAIRDWRSRISDTVFLDFIDTADGILAACVESLRVQFELLEHSYPGITALHFDAWEATVLLRVVLYDVASLWTRDAWLARPHTDAPSAFLQAYESHRGLVIDPHRTGKWEDFPTLTGHVPFILGRGIAGVVGEESHLRAVPHGVRIIDQYSAGDTARGAVICFIAPSN